MKRRMSVALSALVGVGILSQSVLAVDNSWNGTVGNYETAASWSLGTVPNIAPGGDTVVIDGATKVVTYRANDGSPALGDFSLNTTATIRNGATWIQDTGYGAWLKIGEGGGNSGTLNVLSGATFDSTNAGVTFVGTGGATGTVNLTGGTMRVGNAMDINSGSVVNINSGGKLTKGSLVSDSPSYTLNAGGTINVNGGTFEHLRQNIGGAFAYSGSLNMTDGTMSFAKEEFKPLSGSTTSISGGTLDTQLIGFESAPAVINFSGGEINLSRSNDDTYVLFATVANSYLNFTAGSNGVLHLVNYTPTEVTAQGFLTSGVIREAGVINPALFKVESDDLNGSFITVLDAVGVPEPTSIGFLTIGAATLLLRRRRINN